MLWLSMMTILCVTVSLSTEFFAGDPADGDALQVEVKPPYFRYVFDRNFSVRPRDKFWKQKAIFSLYQIAQGALLRYSDKPRP